MNSNNSHLLGGIALVLVLLAARRSPEVAPAQGSD